MGTYDFFRKLNDSICLALIDPTVVQVVCCSFLPAAERRLHILFEVSLGRYQMLLTIRDKNTLRLM